MPVFFALIFLFGFSVMSPQMLDDGLEKPKQNSLILNSIVMHDAAEDLRTGFHPKNALESLGERGIAEMKIYCVYISLKNNDAGKHIQKIELLSPSGKLIFSSRKQFKVKAYQPRFGPFQRGYIEQRLIFPPLSRQKKNFGLYILRISLDGRHMRDFYIPVFAQ